MPALLLALLLFAQEPKTRPDDPATVRLPDGKLQSEEILKAEHKRTNTFSFAERSFAETRKD